MLRRICAHGPDACVGLCPEVGTATELLAGYRAIERSQGSIEYLDNTVSAAADPLVRDAVLEAMAFLQLYKKGPTAVGSCAVRVSHLSIAAPSFRSGLGLQRVDAGIVVATPCSRGIQVPSAAALVTGRRNYPRGRATNTFSAQICALC